MLFLTLFAINVLVFAFKMARSNAYEAGKNDDDKCIPPNVGS
jgi:hypothetical protein